MNVSNPVVVDLNLARIARFPSLDANCTASTDYNSSPGTFFGQQVTCFHDVNPNIVVDGNWFLDINASDKSGNIGIDSTPQQATGTESGLISAWNLNSGSITTLTDANATGARDGNVSGTITSNNNSPVEGKYLTYPTSTFSAFSNATPFQITRGTISGWVRSTNFDDVPAFHGIFLKQLNYSMFIYFNEFIYYTWSGSPAINSSGISITDGKWHHVVNTFDSGVAGGTKLYLDGRVVYAGTYTKSDDTESLVAASGNDVGTQNLLGDLEDLSIWNSYLGKRAIREKAGVLLINTTNNAPTVSSVTPTSAGQSCDGSASETYNITWTSDDEDLDDLTFSLYYDTSSGGKTNTILTGLTQEDVSCEAPEDTSCSYTWSCPDTDDDFYITVTASDGIQSTDGTSSNTIHIIPEYDFIALSLAILAALGIVLRRSLLAA